MSAQRPAGPRLPTIELCGMSLARITSAELLDHIFAELEAGRGGWLVTANLDFVRRHARDEAARRIYAGADLRVADGMPLVWASRLQGTPLPERVAGSSLVVPLCARAAREGRRVYLLGGDPRASEEAARRLCAEIGGLALAGRSAPRVGSGAPEADLEPIRGALCEACPDLVLVALGSPKQELVIARLRHELPGAWWIGVGASLSFVAGHIRRAPPLLQRLGLEWAHRLAQEPRRLFRRYLVDDAPFAFELFARSLRSRRAARRGATEP
jgi:N-acetylglucosaminyldiphosphoundecaprenol N-acetyl-beta-D-mannosaminyltransferase